MVFAPLDVAFPPLVLAADEPCATAICGRPFMNVLCAPADELTRPLVRSWFVYVLAHFVSHWPRACGSVLSRCRHTGEKVKARRCDRAFHSGIALIRREVLGGTLSTGLLYAPVVHRQNQSRRIGFPADRGRHSGCADSGSANDSAIPIRMIRSMSIPWRKNARTCRANEGCSLPRLRMTLAERRGIRALALPSRQSSGSMASQPHRSRACSFPSHLRKPVAPWCVLLEICAVRFRSYSLRANDGQGGDGRS